MLLNASYRDSKRVETGAQFAANASPTTGTGYEARPQDLHRRRLVGDQLDAASSRPSTPTSRTRRRAVPTTTADVYVPSTAPGTRARHREPRHAGPAHGARAGRRANAYNAFVAAAHRPLRLRRRTACTWAAASSGYGLQFDNDDFFRDAGAVRLQPDARHERRPRAPLRLPVPTPSRRTCSAPSNGWGADLGAGRPVAAVNGQRRLLHRAHPAAAARRGRGRSTPSPRPTTSS